MPVQNRSAISFNRPGHWILWNLETDLRCSILWPSTSSPRVAAGNQNSFTASTLWLIPLQCPVPRYMLWHGSPATSLSLSLLCVQKLHHWMMTLCCFSALFNMEAGRASQIKHEFTKADVSPQSSGRKPQYSQVIETSRALRSSLHLTEVKCHNKQH